MRLALHQSTLRFALSFCFALSLLSSAQGQTQPSAAPRPTPVVVIPGPLRSFLRMAGISQKIPPEDVLPELARNVYAQGYGGGRETEFLVLLQRYVRQARDLQNLASPHNEIRVNRCEDAGPLLQILGYRMQGTCGQKDLALLTFNPENAFLTIDSGFPLTRLEESLQTGRPFSYPYVPSAVPVLLAPTDWSNISMWRKSIRLDVLDVLTHDPHVARLYWAFSRMDPETRTSLQHSEGLYTLLPYASVFDFYGTQLSIRNHRVLVPGGVPAEQSWADLVGASPRSPGEFIMRLVEQDHGWLAAYYDTLARVDQKQQGLLIQGPRLHRFYDAFREPGTSTYAAGAAYRNGSQLLILFLRQQWLPSGEPLVPGTVDLWKQILGKHGRHISRPEQVLEAMISASRQDTDSGPLEVYLTFGALNRERNDDRIDDRMGDRGRTRAPQATLSPAALQTTLSPSTMLLMADHYAELSSWYPIFAEFPQLTDDSISRFIHVADTLNKLSDMELRGNALGTLQANIGLWQILSRQHEIPGDQLASSWQKIIEPFDHINSPAHVFNAGEASLSQLLLAATGSSTYSQGQLIDLLAGPPSTRANTSSAANGSNTANTSSDTNDSEAARKVRSVLARRIHSVLDDQRLTSLDTLQQLAAGLDAMSHGAPPSDKVLALAGDLRQFELPRPIFTKEEKLTWAPESTDQRHTLVQVHTDLPKLLQEPNSSGHLDAARGLLAPFLRDTLVGLNYAYYEPIGSQILHINPLFVRSHDFSGQTIVGEKYVWQASTLFGQGASAGGGAYLVGSLADLPYVLASTEQNFISPRNVQALIWEEVAPSLMAGATLSRWWNVGPHELHAVALYQRSGEELITASATNPRLRDHVGNILSDRISPQELQRLESAWQTKDVSDAIARLMPADTFYLAVEFRQRFPQETSWPSPAQSATQALDQLCRQYPDEVNLDRISRDFGVPHPTLAQTYARELLNVRTFPAYAGYSNRLFGESWDSGNLYWARVADERSDSPEQLNVLAPQLTRIMISRIFATDLEDWPSLVRTMHETRDDLMHGNLAQPAETAIAER